MGTLNLLSLGHVFNIVSALHVPDLVVGIENGSSEAYSRDIFILVKGES